MGNELPCTLRHQGKSFSGKALLETAELLFRGETRLKIPFRSIKTIQAKGGELHVRTNDGTAVFELGSQAEKWREKIANPKSVLEKLGVKTGQSVAVLGDFPESFFDDLKKAGAAILKSKPTSKSKPTKDVLWVFFAANQTQDLGKLASLSKSIQGSTALWIVYLKGQKAITEAGVRAAGLKAGLVDVKVVSFSPTHTALKFVLPVAKR